MKVALGVLLLLVAPLGAVYAQTVGASLQGTIYDPSGAVIPRVQVEVRNIETSATRTVVTDEGGHWREPVLPPSENEMRVSPPGFQTIPRKSIRLSLRQDAGVHLPMGL